MWPLLTHVFILQNFGEEEEDEARPLAESLLLAIADLLFCLDFTVQSTKKKGPVRLRSGCVDISLFIWMKKSC